MCLWNISDFENSHFFLSVTLVFDLDLDKWPWALYHQMYIDKMFLSTKDEPCN